MTSKIEYVYATYDDDEIWEYENISQAVERAIVIKKICKKNKGENKDENK